MDEIVSDEGIHVSRYKKLIKLCDIIPKLAIILNAIKKIIALFSTIFMIDCKLTGEGHFGLECIDQVRVISVDNSLLRKPHIHQNGEEISIELLNQREECLLPSC